MDSMRLFKRQSTGVYYVRLARGKEKSLKTKDKGLAEKIFRKLKREILLGKIISLEKQENPRFSEFRKEYLQLREAEKRKSTVDTDKQALKALHEIIGDMFMRSITPKVIDSFHMTLLKRGMKATSVNVYFRHLRKAFNQALKWGYIKENPYADKEQLPEDERMPRWLRDSEFSKIFEVIDDIDFERIVKWYLYLGCRRAELVYFTWQNVLLDLGLVMIESRYSKRRRVKVLPIPAELKPIVEEMKKEAEAAGRQKGRVFPRWKDPDTITHKWEHYRELAGLSDVRLHDLRHTFASHLAQKGVPQKKIQELLGHAKLSTTDIYTHLFPEHLREALDQLDFAGKMQAIKKPRLVSSENNGRKKK
jgi:site-specific recombinase XerD